MQITILSDGEKRLPEVFTFLIIPRSISSVALKSAITPSFSGRIVLMLGLVFSCICRACWPMATSLPECTSSATIDGSSTTTFPL